MLVNVKIYFLRITNCTYNFIVGVIVNMLRLNNNPSARYNYCRVSGIKKKNNNNRKKCLFLNYILARLNLWYYFTRNNYFFMSIIKTFFDPPLLRIILLCHRGFAKEFGINTANQLARRFARFFHR